LAEIPWFYSWLKSSFRTFEHPFSRNSPNHVQICHSHEPLILGPRISAGSPGSLNHRKEWLWKILPMVGCWLYSSCYGNPMVSCWLVG
jgi:hypothetical protein